MPTDTRMTKRQAVVIIGVLSAICWTVLIFVGMWLVCCLITGKFP
jgi:hypothetical protein